MQPLIFDTMNGVFGANQKEYQPLPAEVRGKKSTGEVLTCWEFSPEELKIVQETGRIWLSVLTYGHPLQPLFLSTTKPEVYDPE